MQIIGHPDLHSLQATVARVGSQNMLTTKPHSVLGLFEKQTNGYSRNSSHHRSKHLVTMRRLALEALEGGEGGALYPFFSIFWSLVFVRHSNHG